MWKLLILPLFCCLMGFAEMPALNNQQNILNMLEDKAKMLQFLIQNIQENPSDTPQNKNLMINNVIQKDLLTDQFADLLSREFLQKYISSSDTDLTAKLLSIHKMLNLCYKIKTGLDMADVNSLMDELSQFKSYMKLNYKSEPTYKTYRYREYKPAN